jgi:hypothetical protein
MNGNGQCAGTPPSALSAIAFGEHLCCSAGGSSCAGVQRSGAATPSARRLRAGRYRAGEGIAFAAILHLVALYPSTALLSVLGTRKWEKVDGWCGSWRRGHRGRPGLPAEPRTERVGPKPSRARSESSSGVSGPQEGSAYSAARRARLSLVYHRAPAGGAAYSAALRARLGRPTCSQRLDSWPGSGNRSRGSPCPWST